MGTAKGPLHVPRILNLCELPHVDMTYGLSD